MKPTEILSQEHRVIERVLREKILPACRARVFRFAGQERGRFKRFGRKRLPTLFPQLGFGW